jgi:transposase
VQLEQRVVDLEKQLAVVLAANETLAAEREEYRRLYLQMLELCKKLEAGIVGPKRERLSASDAQLTLSLLAQLLGDRAGASAPAIDPVEQVRAHTRQKPTGRRPLPEHLPRVDVEVLPPEVEQRGRDAFERIGEDVAETIERRPASLVVVRVHKPKFVPRQRDRLGETQVLQASSPELPIERALAGPGMLADTIVKRWQDHLPLNRLEKTYARDGLELARSTICGWHAELSNLVRPLIRAMWDDALGAPYLCTDATGVLVQALEKCRRAHFWVVLAPELHVLFGYSPRHDSAAVDRMLRGYKGKLVLDAHAVFDHLFKNGDVIECGCWSHGRRYFYKALPSDPDRAHKALAFISGLFQIERRLKDTHAPPSRRLEIRQAESKPIVAAFFAWADAEAPLTLGETPIAKAIGYVRNQRKALEQFLEDGRLPIHNNASERELRRQAIGRKNWLFVGSDDGGEVNAAFVTLLASCQLHKIEPWTYLRDLFCLLPNWPQRRVLQLAPAYWNKTLQDQDAQQRLAANIFRKVTLGPLELHRVNQ